MSSRTAYEFDVLVIGAGPAGMAAATTAAECGARVGVVDDNFYPGGQIWRTPSASAPLPEAGKWFQQLQAAPVQTAYGVRVFDQLQTGVLVGETAEGVCEFRYSKLILATGARERFLPFPGWTLPNVVGAGGLQAMVKGGLPIAGKRVVLAGTGQLLIAVASYLRKYGANIALICEQAAWRTLSLFGAALVMQPGKLRDALHLRLELAGVPYATSTWPLAAKGKEVLESVVVSRGGRTETIACDYLACGFHLVPNTELAALLGCRMERGCVRVDELQQTSVPGVFCAGEPTGIGGVDLALVEGKIAGFAAAGRPEQARGFFAQRKKGMKFSAALDTAFRLRAELRSIPAADTLVCRCEDVPYARLQPYTTWRAAKLQTRCGMGPCQGRVCGPAVQFLFKWHPDSVRPPIFPARVESWTEVVRERTEPQPVVNE